MTTVLTVVRSRQGEANTTHRLQTFGDDTFAISAVADGETQGLHFVQGAASATALDVVRRYRRLHLARLGERTSFVCEDSKVLSSSDLLRAVRINRYGTPEHHGWSSPDLLDLADHTWSTRHDITLNGQRLFGTPGVPLVVTADDYLLPHNGWKEVLSFSWDSGDYAGPGAAGFGTSGIYRPRPDLIATVTATDESLEVGFDRVTPRTTDLALFLRAVHADIFSDRLAPHLVLAAYGFRASDLVPADTLGSALPAVQIRTLLRSLSTDAPRERKE